MSVKYWKKFDLLNETELRDAKTTILPQISSPKDQIVRYANLATFFLTSLSEALPKENPRSSIKI